jgi:hypothetical protein
VLRLQRAVAQIELTDLHDPSMLESALMQANYFVVLSLCQNDQEKRPGVATGP